MTGQNGDLDEVRGVKKTEEAMIVGGWGEAYLT